MKLMTFHKISVVYNYAFMKYLLSCGFTFGTFQRWLQNFGFVCTDLKFWSFELGDGESSKLQNFGFVCTDLKFWSFELGNGLSSKSQYRSYLLFNKCFRHFIPPSARGRGWIQPLDFGMLRQVFNHCATSAGLVLTFLNKLVRLSLESYYFNWRYFEAILYYSLLFVG